MEYSVSIQDKFYKLIEGEDVLEVLRIISRDITDNKIEWLDPEKPHGIEIKPTNTNDKTE